MENTYLPKTFKYSTTEFYAKATLSSQVLCCKHYISMYLDEYLAELWLSAKTIWSHNTLYPLNLKVMECMCNIFQIYVLLDALNFNA